MTLRPKFSLASNGLKWASLWSSMSLIKLGFRGSALRSSEMEWSRDWMVQRPYDRVRSNGCHEVVIDWLLRLLFSSLFSTCLVWVQNEQIGLLVIEWFWWGDSSGVAIEWNWRASFSEVAIEWFALEGLLGCDRVLLLKASLGILTSCSVSPLVFYSF